MYSNIQLRDETSDRCFPTFKLVFYLKISAPFLLSLSLLSFSLHLDYAFQFENIFGEIYLLSRLVSLVLFFFCLGSLLEKLLLFLSLSCYFFVCLHFHSPVTHKHKKSVKWSERKARIILIKNVTLGGSRMMLSQHEAKGEKVYRI